MVDGCVTSHIKVLGRLKKRRKRRRRKEEVKNKVEKRGSGNVI